MKTILRATSFGSTCRNFERSRPFFLKQPEKTLLHVEEQSGVTIGTGSDAMSLYSIIDFEREATQLRNSSVRIQVHLTKHFRTRMYGIERPSLGSDGSESSPELSLHERRLPRIGVSSRY